MTILDHIKFAVSDAEASRRSYEAALAPLDIVLVRRPPGLSSGRV